MEYAVVATPADELGLRLDWERFAYAGKFVMTNTGKAVAAADDVLADPAWPPDPRTGQADGVLAAVSFNRDRTRDDTAWLRYVTVRRDQRGEGIGPRLCATTTDWLLGRDGVSRVRIAVNNPYAYDALHKAGFAWTGETTGLRERVLESTAPAVDDGAGAGDGAGGGDGAWASDGAGGGDGSRAADETRADRYRAGLRTYLDTASGDPGLDDAERDFVDSRLARGPPPLVDAPKGEDYTGGARTHR